MTRVALAALALLASAPLAAQERSLVAAGRVVRISATDTMPADAATVVLHRIGRDRQAPIDSTRTDISGRFGFRFAADTTALYLLTSRHDGIQYFSAPVHTNPDRPDTALVLAVHDTSSRQPVWLAGRSIVVSAPGADGTRNVVEVLALRNDGPLTRVPSDTIAPAWAWRIPREVAGFAADEGELSAGAVALHGDTVVVRAAIPPGLREVTVEYFLPAGRDEARFAFDDTAESVNLLVEESGASLTLPEGLVPDSATVIEERRFRRWSGTVASGEAIVASLPVAGRWGGSVVGLMIAALAMALVAGALRAFRHTAGTRPPAPDTAGTDALIEAIARLDAAHAASGPHDAETEQRHAERRAALKEELARALARATRPV